MFPFKFTPHTNFNICKLQGVLEASDVDGDRKVSLEQCYLTFHTSCQKMADNVAHKIQNQMDSMKRTN